MLFATLIGYMLVLARDSILPDRFLADGELIRDIALGIASADDSYTNTALVYRMLGIADSPLLAYIAGYSLAVVAIGLVWSKCRRLGGDWGPTIMTVVALVFAAVYLGYYSKDVMILPIIIALILLPLRWWSGPFLLGLMLVYADLFRTYWFITAGLFVAFWAVERLVGRRKLILWGLAATVAVSIALALALHVSADNFRTQVNETRLGRIDVGSIITPFVTLPEPLGGVVNNALTYLSLIFPIPIVARGGIYYVAIAAVIFSTWFTFFRAAGRPMSVEAEPLVMRANALILAFVVTQSLFEPDYGSALRHLTPLMPLLLYVVWQSIAKHPEPGQIGETNAGDEQYVSMGKREQSRGSRAR
ncbi:hypothetical protein [Microbacterium natoriense]